MRVVRGAFPTAAFDAAGLAELYGGRPRFMRKFLEDKWRREFQAARSAFVSATLAKPLPDSSSGSKALWADITLPDGSVVKANYVNAAFDSIEVDCILKICIGGGVDWTQDPDVARSSGELFFASTSADASVPTRPSPPFETARWRRSCAQSDASTCTALHYDPLATFYIVGEVFYPLPKNAESHSAHHHNPAVQKLLQLERLLQFLSCKECKSVKDCVGGALLIGPTFNRETRAHIVDELRNFPARFPCLCMLQGLKRLLLLELPQSSAAAVALFRDHESVLDRMTAMEHRLADLERRIGPLAPGAPSITHVGTVAASPPVPAAPAAAGQGFSSLPDTLTTDAAPERADVIAASSACTSTTPMQLPQQQQPLPGAVTAATVIAAHHQQQLAYAPAVSLVAPTADLDATPAAAAAFFPQMLMQFMGGAGALPQAGQQQHVQAAVAANRLMLMLMAAQNPSSFMSMMQNSVAAAAAGGFGAGATIAGLAAGGPGDLPALAQYGAGSGYYYPRPQHAASHHQLPVAPQQQAQQQQQGPVNHSGAAPPQEQQHQHQQLTSPRFYGGDYYAAHAAPSHAAGMVGGAYGPSVHQQSHGAGSGSRGAYEAPQEQQQQQHGLFVPPAPTHGGYAPPPGVGRMFFVGSGVPAPLLPQTHAPSSGPPGGGFMYQPQQGAPPAGSYGYYATSAATHIAPPPGMGGPADGALAPGSCFASPSASISLQPQQQSSGGHRGGLVVPSGAGGGSFEIPPQQQQQQGGGGYGGYIPMPQQHW